MYVNCYKQFEIGCGAILNKIKYNLLLSCLLRQIIAVYAFHCTCYVSSYILRHLGYVDKTVFLNFVLLLGNIFYGRHLNISLFANVS